VEYRPPAGRADSKRYPAIDPLESYSKYLEYPEIREYLDEHIEKDWVDLVYAGKTIVQRGKEANDQFHIITDQGGSVPVFIGNVDRLEKRVTRAYRRTLFGSLTNVWLFDRRCVTPNFKQKWI
jgi:hypothetical protein